MSTVYCNRVLPGRPMLTRQQGGTRAKNGVQKIPKKYNLFLANNQAV